MRAQRRHPAASRLGRLRAVGLVEGASFLLLLFVAMPLKYIGGMPQYVSVVGAIHGALWITYVIAIIDMRIATRWRWRRVVQALVASVLPFGPFVLEPGLRAEQRAHELAALAPPLGELDPNTA